MTDKLKNCPFCGGEAVQLFSVNAETYVYGCYKRGCMGNALNSLHHFKTDKEAIEAWNTRKPMDRIVEQLERLPNVNSDYWNFADLIDRDDALEIVKGVQNGYKDKSE